MAFSEDTIKRAWKRQGGRCAVCGKQLGRDNRDKGERGAWHAHHNPTSSPRSADYLSNCVILCINPPNCDLNVGHDGDFKKRVRLVKDQLPYFRYGEKYGK